MGYDKTKYTWLLTGLKDAMNYYQYIMEIGDFINISKKKTHIQEDPGILARCPSTYGYMDMQFAPYPEYTYIIQDKRVFNDFTVYNFKCVETPETRIGFELIYSCRNMKWYVRISQVGYELEEAVVHRVGPECASSVGY